MTDLQALHDSTHTMVMGVLNITEDSASDGGLWLDPAKAAQHGRDMMAAGADIIDIGAESTRPGAKRVAEADELARITGAVKTLIPAGAILSIDTTRASVAAAALSEGAQIINDVSGGTLDAELPHVVADHDCLYIVQHWRGWLAGSKGANPEAGAAGADGPIMAQRDDVTAALSALSAEHGAWAVRVHDVAKSRAAVIAGNTWREYA